MFIHLQKKNMEPSWFSKSDLILPWEKNSSLKSLLFLKGKFQQTYLEIYMWSYLNASQCIIQNTNPSAAKEYCNHIINLICVE